MAANIIITNGSLDISITQVDFNGVTATVVIGTLPNTTGNGTGLETTEIGTYNLDISYGATIGGQHIYVTDSNGGEYCQDNGAPPGGVLTFTNILYDGITSISIDVQDGTCSSLPTPTPTPNSTPTPTPCPCNEFSISIGSTDTNDATGNTGGLAIYNGVVVWTYTDCVTGLSTEELLSSGTYNLCACGLGSSLIYWKNNVQNGVTDSSVNPVGPCGLSPSPTPTPTQTETPTPPTPSQSSTPDVTPTPTPTPQCGSCSGTGWEPYEAGTCYRINVTGATAPVSSVPLIPRSGVEYSVSGTSFYDTGFNYDGTGTILLNSSTAPLWKNSPINFVNGPMNRSAVWYSAYTITDTWLGFSTCLTGITNENTYYVGIGADNEYRLVLDGVEILNTLGGSMPELEKFNWWHVYPVTIPSGNHTLELYGLDYGIIAGFGMEIYDNTLAELTGATTLGDLNIIFSSSGYTVADLVQTTGGTYLSSGYTCPSGYVYSTCSGSCIEYEYCNTVPTPTPTATETPTPTQTQTPTPSVTLGLTPTSTETQTPTPTQTPTNTETPTQTPTETSTQTPTQTPTNTETPTQTQTETPTQTPSQTPTNTQTPTPTTTVTASLGFIVQMVDCTNSSNVFRFDDTTIPSTTGVTYLITGSSEFEGCATVVPTDGSGPIYDGTGVTFIITAGGCGDSVCPRSSNRAALLYKCSDSTIFYANVEEDTAFVGAAYLYNGECYSFVEFSGPGGPDIGDPDYADCISCVSTPTPTATPRNTPTPTPTVSVTPSACTYNEFCFYTMLPSLSGYNGNYTSAGIYNTKEYYTGDGTITAVIYYTGNYWCLASGATPGGTCVLQGATPCYSQCPDISANDFVGGICPTPTPTAVDCSIFNFNAYFDCDWEPLPTPTPSVACDDVNFIINSSFVTPTPTPSGDFCANVGMSFSMSGYTPAITPTVTLTPSITLTRTVDVQGQATFHMLDETFSCVSVKVLTDCQTGVEYYVNDNLIYDEIPVVTGVTMFASINEINVCATYTRDDSNFSANANVDAIFQIYTICGSCSTLPTPTPTVTSTPTTTPSSTPTKTPTNTPTSTLTPSPTSTLGSTPPPTPSQTQTQTPTQTTTQTMTPTPSTTPNYVYVYQSCSPIGKNTQPTQMIQSQKVTFATEAGAIFKDSSNNCWTYLGRFLATYIAPQNVSPVTFDGNYFDGSSSTVYQTCESCEALPVVFCDQYLYWSGTRCDNGQTVTAKSCYAAPIPIVVNTFEFGFAGSFTQLWDINPQVGDFVLGNDGTVDFCMSITSALSTQTTNITVAKPLTPVTCLTCPVYKKYTANACDGSEQNVTIYALSTSPTLAVGAVVSTGLNITCYTIISYDGLVADQFTLPSITKFVQDTFLSCTTCNDSFNVIDDGGE
jgi:hypothetical protein